MKRSRHRDGHIDETNPIYWPLRENKKIPRFPPMRGFTPDDYTYIVQQCKRTHLHVYAIAEATHH